eukprot:CAMPEP_0177785234 /NCGR_PEP_ID=MMETSP0491_2-20121128/20184_1 /TAXON_ID=63592 /ORGANISM="Tetraselmis chuii, Strain PLY429" /LENGTH=182 /DNA_ID=CAMNT_0019306171 /DNA_START=154 /DNA_END=702 /DNA_ORIENTATION=+
MTPLTRTATAVALLVVFAVSRGAAARGLSDFREARRNDGPLDSMREGRRNDDGMMDQARAANRGEGTYTGSSSSSHGNNSPLMNAMATQQAMEDNYEQFVDSAQGGGLGENVNAGRSEFYNQVDTGKDELNSEVDQGLDRADAWEDDFEESWANEMEDISRQADEAFAEADSWASDFDSDWD